jgi:hypothetical protein
MELKRSVIFAKIESSVNTDPTPVANTDAIEIHGDPTFEPVTKSVQRTKLLASFGEQAPMIIGEAYKLSGLKIPFKASGTAGTAPRVGVFLRGLGFAQTISNGVSVTYALHSSYDTETFTIYFWMGGKKHIMLGCVCSSGKLDWTAGEIKYLDCDVIGMYGGTIADVTFPTPTFESTLPEIWQNANFALSVGGTPVSNIEITKMSFDLGIEAAKRADANGAYGIKQYYIKDRKSKCSLDPLQLALSDFNPYTIHTDQSIVAFETKPTASAGSIMELTFAGYTMETPKAGERDGSLTWDLSLKASPTQAAGNNELTIVFK